MAWERLTEVYTLGEAEELEPVDLPDRTGVR
jgi:hypothetical protein